MQGLLADLSAFYEGLFHKIHGRDNGWHSHRTKDDYYVTGGTHWDGYSLESLIRMVADQANPAQLQFLADTWRRQGGKVSTSAENLQQSLVTLMQYWTGAGADEASTTVAKNSQWISHLGATATKIAEPVDDSGGALRSAQSTMPGAPKGGFWSGLGTAGGAAAAGFAVGGPFGAAAGAVIGGLASAFGFGSSKKKLKRKAVQTMSRYEGAILNIDRATPQFVESANSTTDPIWTDPTHRGGVGPLPPGVTLPGHGGHVPPGEGGPGGSTGPGAGGGIGGGIGAGVGSGSHIGTTPSFTESPSGRWASMTGVGPYGLGTDGLGGLGGGGFGDDMARGGRMFGAGLGAGAAGGAAGMGLGASGMPMAGAGGYGMGADAERAGSKYGRAGMAGRAGTGGYGPGGMGAGANKEEDQEHKRRFPVEEDLFTGDLKAAPPVIGL